MQRTAAVVFYPILSNNGPTPPAGLQIIYLMVPAFIPESSSLIYYSFAQYQKLDTCILPDTRYSQLTDTSSQCLTDAGPYDVGPALVKHWLDVSCLLGYPVQTV